MKRIFAVLLALLLLLPQGEFVLAAQNGETAAPQVEETDPWAGFDEFSTAVSKLLDQTMEEPYIAAVTLGIDSSEMTVNGEEQPVIEGSDAAPVIKDDTVMLPVRTLASCESAKVAYDSKSKTATVQTEEGEISFTRGEVTAAVSDTAAETETLALLSAEPELIDGTMYVPLETMADFLGYEAEMDGERIVLTKPFQTKRLIVKSAVDDLEDFGATEEIAGFNDLHILQYDTEQDTKDAMLSLKLSGDVDYVEPDLVVAAAEDHKSWGTEAVGADTYSQFLQETTSLDEIVVAVVDTGVDSNHVFLEGRIAPGGKNFVNSNSSSDDDHGHGTHVAGIIRDATPNNVKLLPVKVLNSFGQGSLTSIYNGIQYAIQQNCDVMNASLGGFGKSDLLEEVILSATSQNIPMVVAAGNDCLDALTGNISSVDQAIVVGALDKSLHYAEYSNYGQTVDIWAPGSDILSSVPGSLFEEKSGTSMASPLVAAAVAMLKTHEKDLSPRQIELILSQYAVDLSIGEPNSVGMAKVLSAASLKQFVAAEQQEVVAMPELSEVPGYYQADSLTIEMACETPGAEIRYTTDGTVPTAATGSLYTGPVSFQESVQLTVRAFKEGWIDSYKKSGAYFISLYPESMHNYSYSYYEVWNYQYPDENVKCLKVTFDDQTYIPYPDPENEYARRLAELKGHGISLYDSTGLVRNEYSEFDKAVFVEGDLTGKEIYLQGNEFSILLLANLSSQDYGFKITKIEPFYGGILSAPRFVVSENGDEWAPAAYFARSNDFESRRPLVLESEEDAEIYYTLDGSAPDESSTRYTGPVALDQPALVRAKAYKDGWGESKISSAYIMATSKYPESLHYKRICDDERPQINFWQWRAPGNVAYMAVTFDEKTALCLEGEDPASKMCMDFSLTEATTSEMMRSTYASTYLPKKFYGSELAGKTLLIPGCFFHLRTQVTLKKGESAPYGFKITNIKYYYEGEDVPRDGCIELSPSDSESGSQPEEGQTFFVSTADELIFLTSLSDHEDIKIYLTNDLDFTGKEWPADGFPYFSGVLDGQDHSISNLSSEKKLYFIKEAQETAVVKNLRFDNFGGIHTAKETSNCAQIIYCNRGKVLNVTANGFMYSSWGTRIGGIVGWNRKTGHISNCHVTGTVYGHRVNADEIGGIVGYNEGIVDTCTMKGNVIGPRSVGGICGVNVFEGILANCSSFGSCICNASEEKIRGNPVGQLGGIVGTLEGALPPKRSETPVKKCYSAMTVYGGKAQDTNGALIGMIKSIRKDYLYARSNVALGNTMTGENELRRVAGFSLTRSDDSLETVSGINLWDCYAWDGMRIGPADAPETVENTAKYPSGSLDGMDVTKETVRTKAFWEDLGFDFESGVWHWEDGKMPYTSSQNAWDWPEWLRLDTDGESEESVLPTVIFKPTAKSLFYNEKAQALLSEGTVFGGVIEYSLEEKGEYSTQIPEQTGVGSYTVWYRVTGDEVHGDIPPSPIEVTIQKRSPPSASEGSGLTGTVGDPLSSVKLSEGWSWVNPDTVLTCGLKSYPCFYPETDTEYAERLGVYINVPHVLSKTEAKPASCSEEGCAEYWTCSVCNAVFFDGDAKKSTTLSALTIQKLPHTPDISAPTCTQPQICTVCGQVAAAALGHKPDRIAADCTHDQTCTVCGAVLTEKLGHDYKDTVVTPTCTEKGYTTHTCTRCGDSYADHETAAKGHTPGEAADCTHDQTCTVCGAVLAEKLGHDYKDTVTPPTCMEKGYTTHTCTRCGDSYTDSETSPLGHDYKDTVVSPTCTEKGYTTHTCTRCKDSYTDSETEPLGHSWGEWIQIKAPTVDKPGEEQRQCKRCGKAETRSVTHTHVREIIPEVKPSCTKTGLTEGARCKECGEMLLEQKIVPALGHNWESCKETISSTCTKKGEEGRTCARCGETETRELPLKAHTPGKAADCTHDQTCTVCGTVLAEKLGHDYKDTVALPTCTEGGYTTHTCTRCGDGYTDSETVAKGHTPGEWRVVTPATAAQEGLKQKECTVCHTVLETEVIPKEQQITPSNPSYPSFEPEPEPEPTPQPPAKLPFADVKEGAWYYEPISWAYENGLMSGITETAFSPNTATTRGMIVTILWRLEEQPKSTASMAFTDVRTNAFYYEPIRWAAEQGIIKGKSAASFAPNDPISRQEMAAVLYRYAQYTGSGNIQNGTEILRFSDTGNVSDWAKEPMTWAVDRGVIAGKKNGILDPKGKATRAETASMLMRYVQKAE